MDWEDTKQHFCILLYHEIIIKNNLELFLTIKAKYILKYDIRISTEAIVCHTDTINY